MKRHILTLIALCTLLVSSQAQVKVYRSGGGEIIFSQADVRTMSALADPNYPYSNKVNTNTRFTLFFHAQQFVNLDLSRHVGFFGGAAIRNVGLITEDLFQRVGFNHINPTDNGNLWNKSTKVKRRSYSLGFPLAMKLGAIDKHYFIYAGGEYEWMFHYKQKLFIDGEKYKEKEWGSERVNPWVPSFFAGIQFPGGLNLKFKYYLKDFLNPDFQGVDFADTPYAQQVDYSQFERSGIWYISLSIMLNRQQLEKMLDTQSFDKAAYR